MSFEEIRTLTFLLRKRRLLTVNIRLPNSRTSTIRFGMRETVERVTVTRQGAEADYRREKSGAHLRSCEDVPLPLTDFMVKHVPHNNSTLLLLPVRPGAPCAPPLLRPSSLGRNLTCPTCGTCARRLLN